jgi:DNA polymerase delta subunit 2
MLVEYICGEIGGSDDASSAARITRLIIAGNSLFPQLMEDDGPKERKAVRQSAIRAAS